MPQHARCPPRTRAFRRRPLRWERLSQRPSYRGPPTGRPDFACAVRVRPAATIEARWHTHASGGSVLLHPGGVSEMAEVTRRRTGEFLRKLFELLMASPDGLPAKEALAALGARVKMTEYEAGEYESGSRRFEKIVRFATVDTVKAGWLLKESGVWSVTDAGRKAYEKFPDPEVFYKEAVRLY